MPFYTQAQFFMPMIPPTVTYQQHRFKSPSAKGQRTVVFDDHRLKAAKDKLRSHLAREYSRLQAQGFVTIRNEPIRLVTKWLFPISGVHKSGEYKITKPDTTNLQKALEDIMTDITFWKDDSLIASSITEKFFSDCPGIFIQIQTLVPYGGD